MIRWVPLMLYQIVFHVYDIDYSNSIYELLTKRKVKMAGYWPSSFFCAFMDRDEVEVHKHRRSLVNKGIIS